MKNINHECLRCDEQIDVRTLCMEKCRMCDVRTDTTFENNCMTVVTHTLGGKMNL